MRHGVPCAPLLSPSPSPPSLNATAPVPAANNSMLLSVFLALFLPCAGMSAVFIVYIFLLWYSSGSQMEISVPEKPTAKKGLSEAELEKLPKITGKELVMGTECAVCLDEIEGEQPARLVPGCNHGFHVECADTWLSRHSACPVCRAKIDAQFLSSYCHETENLC